MAPSDGESNSFSTSRTSLVIGSFKIWLGPSFLSTSRSVMLRTSFFASPSILNVLAIGHWFRWQSFLSKTISPTANFWFLFFHICLTCRLWRSSFLCLLQNSSGICCTRRHLLFEYASGLLISTGWGMATLVFIVRMLLGESGILLFESLMVPIVNGLELMISSTSAINVLSDSSFKEWLWVFNNYSKIVLADRIWRSQTPPIWEAPGGLFYNRIQSAPFSCKKLLILSCFISLNACCNSLLAPTKFVPLSNQTERTVPLLAINLQSAKIKKSASKKSLHSTTGKASEDSTIKLKFWSSFFDY